MPVLNRVADMKDEMAQWRRDLHQNPQTSYEEIYASDLIASKLSEWGIPFRRGLAETGIVATIEGQKTDSGKAIGLRADIDALDMEDRAGQPWASKIPGKMHGCGHDGHTSILLGAAKYLNETRNFNGKVHLIFQPAEEGGGGAIRMIEEGLFKEFPVDAVFGLHNWPYLEAGKIAMRTGPIMASSDSLYITIKGKGGHAAMPHSTIDPVLTGAHIITALQSVVSRNVDPVDQGVVTIAAFHAGSDATNVIPESVQLIGTIRAFRQDTRMMLQKRVKEITENVAAAFGASVEIEITDGYDPTINEGKSMELCARVARKLVGDEHVDTDVAPCMGAEDFGAMLMEKPGCYIFMGQGTKDPKSPHNQGLHSSFYDFNDEILPLGVSYFANLVEEAMTLEK